MSVFLNYINDPEIPEEKKALAVEMATADPEKFTTMIVQKYGSKYADKALPNMKMPDLSASRLPPQGPESSVGLISNAKDRFQRGLNTSSGAISNGLRRGVEGMDQIINQVIGGKDKNLNPIGAGERVLSGIEGINKVAQGVIEGVGATVASPISFTIGAVPELITKLPDTPMPGSGLTPRQMWQAVPDVVKTSISDMSKVVGDKIKTLDPRGVEMATSGFRTILDAFVLKGITSKPSLDAAGQPKNTLSAMQQPISTLGKNMNETLVKPGFEAAKKVVKAFENVTKGILPNTVGSARLPGLPKAAEKVVTDNYANLTKLQENAPLRKFINSQEAKGVNVRRDLAETDLMRGSVDTDGTIRTKTGQETLREYMKPQEAVIGDTLKLEGKTMPLSKLEANMTQAINDSSIKGGAKIRALNSVKEDIAGYKLDAIDDVGNKWIEGKSAGNPLISLEDVHKAKISKYANINYSNPETKGVDKIIAKVLKETVEKTTTSVNVKKLNDELKKYYAMMEFLEKLDGKKVAGGRLGKYFAQTIGAIVGSVGGPLGAAAGSEVAGRLKGLEMANVFGGETGNVLEQSKGMAKALKAITYPTLKR